MGWPHATAKGCCPTDDEPRTRHPTEPPPHSVKAWRWAVAVPVGIAVCVGVGLAINSVVDGRQPEAGWQQNLGLGVVLAVGSFATGTVAQARTREDWIRAVILTFAGLLAAAVVLFAYVAATELPR
jgi:hypothetical protein